MTRFWMTLDKAVNLVLRAIHDSKGGELFVAKNPSFKVVELLEAICPECEIETIGIRPGEKLHETLISLEESRNITDLGEYFVVDSEDFVSPENNITISINNDGKSEWEYTSLNNSEYLSVNQIREYLNYYKFNQS
jgi:FlaA1/EpsC-like NDP-sugar epimerase